MTKQTPFEKKMRNAKRKKLMNNESEKEKEKKYL